MYSSLCTNLKHIITIVMSHNFWIFYTTLFVMKRRYLFFIFYLKLLALTTAEFLYKTDLSQRAWSRYRQFKLITRIKIQRACLRSEARSYTLTRATQPRWNLTPLLKSVANFKRSSYLIPASVRYYGGHLKFQKSHNAETWIRNTPHKAAYKCENPKRQRLSVILSK